MKIPQTLHSLILGHGSIVIPTTGVLPIRREVEPSTNNRTFARSTYHTDSTNPAGVTHVFTLRILHCIRHRVSLCVCVRALAFVYVTLPCQIPFLGELAKLRKATVSFPMYVRMSVRQYRISRRAPDGSS